MVGIGRCLSNLRLGERSAPGWRAQLSGAEPGPYGALTVKGEYLVVQPPKVLEFTWLASWEPGSSPTNVRIELDPVPSGTRVTVVHSGFGDEKKRTDGYTDGWGRVLGWLEKSVR